jgi:hypothetical protein
MELDQAIDLLKKAVKYTGTIDQKHIDLTVVPAEDRGLYEKALVVGRTAILEGKISKDDFYKRLNLDS